MIRTTVVTVESGFRRSIIGVINLPNRLTTQTIPTDHTYGYKYVRVRDAPFFQTTHKSRSRRVILCRGTLTTPPGLSPRVVEGKSESCFVEMKVCRLF